jgi:hypothetical protein
LNPAPQTRSRHPARAFDCLGLIGNRFIELALIAFIEGASAIGGDLLLIGERARTDRARIKRNGRRAVPR